MTIFFKNGFFDTNICEPPEGAVEISAELHQELVEGQSAGMVIRVEADGVPYLAENEGPIVEELLERCKGYAGRMLAATDWAMMPDCALENKAEFTAFRAKMRVLRSAPVTDAEWPAMPKPVWAKE